MSIDLTENGMGFYNLKDHVGHNIVCVSYGATNDDAVNVAIECETCGEVLLSFDKPFHHNNVCGECGSDVCQDENCATFCSNESCEYAKKDWGDIGEPY